MSTYPTYKLGDVADILDSFRKPINSTERTKRIQGKKENELYPYYGATGQVGLIDEFLTDGEYVLVGEDGAPFLEPFKNKSYIIHGKAWVNNHAHILSGKKDVLSNQYLNYFLNSFDYRGYVNGTTRLKLTQGNLVEIPIPLPPLATQRAIVARIESLFAELDKGVEKLKTAQQQLKVYRQAVLNDCLTKGSEKWELVKLGDVLSINNEKYNPIKEEYIFYIGLEHILKNEGKLVDHIGKELIKTLKNKFYKGQILYGKLRPNLNKIYLTDKEGVCSTDILVLDVKEEIEAKFIFYNMFCQRFVNKMSANTNGVNLPRVPTKFILEYPIFLPSLSTQQRIVQEIETRLSQVELVEASVEQSLQQAEALRQSILKKAFSGELV